MAVAVTNGNGFGLSYNYDKAVYRTDISRLDTTHVPKEKIDPALVNDVEAMKSIIRHQMDVIERLEKMVNEMYYPMRTSHE